MKTRQSVQWLPTLAVALGTCCLQASILTPNDLQPPFAVQPFVGLSVMLGVTAPFFSDLSGLPFPGPAVVDILANIMAFDSNGNPITTFQITGVTLMQGSTTLTPPLQLFVVSSPMTYTSSINPFDQITITPSALNLGFTFNSDSSFQYSSTFDVSGVPDGGFVIFDSLETPETPEPDTWSMTGLALAALLGASYRRPRV